MISEHQAAAANPAREEFQSLLAEAKSGSEEAINRLIEDYGDAVMRVVRRRLAPRLRRLYDSQDFAQSVWMSFFAQGLERSHFDGPKELVAFLAAVAGNKVAEQCRRRLMYAKSDENRVLPLKTDFEEFDEVAGRRVRRPSEIVGTQEQIEQVFDGRPAYWMDIAQRRAYGASHAEIAAEMGLNEDSVRRVLRRLARDREP